MSGIRERIDHLLDRRRDARSTAELEAEIDKLRTQNERLRAAMRRCVSCDYRLAVTGDRAGALADPAAEPTDDLSTEPTDDVEMSPAAVAEGAEP
jgi:hypothetical protein